MSASGDADAGIRVRENGPYLLNGEVQVRDATGESVSSEGTVALCRCGGSANKPFCDGTHKRISFDGTETADRGSIADRRDAYEGDGITIYDDRSVCAHAGRCTDGLPSVWRMDTEPWIDPKGASAERIAAVVEQCPSGALAYALSGSADPVEQQLSQEVDASVNGPYHVRGGIPVTGSDGEGYEARDRQTLCRCGGSKNKPFCDGTHWHIGFEDPQGA